MPESEDWPEGRPMPANRHRRDVDGRTGSPAAAARARDQVKWVDLQIRQAIERGEFDDLPGQGKPIQGLDKDYDPDWWLKKLIEREQITGVLPPSLQLRKDDAELDDLLDRQRSEDEARALVEEFNERVIAARYGLPQGPPLITMPRDVEETLARWRERRAARAAEAEAALRRREAAEKPRRKRWWRRG
ncbi:DUF1992 domain-containing protein [Nocardioides sp. KR10-350]|uniref:DnaJ family domain-containing protein n=1 Tax=Nocardioides cheoyonin TaxID=3156615 RepID=UPI0032B3501D